jgi:hypothetical protein
MRIEKSGPLSAILVPPSLWLMPCVWGADEVMGMRYRVVFSLALTVGAIAVAAALSLSATAGSVAPGRACGATIAHFSTKPYERTVVTPPQPGLSATQAGHRVRLQWSFAQMPEKCRPVWLVLSLRDAASNTPAFTPDAFKTGSRQGTRYLTPPSFMKPVWALARALDIHGMPSNLVRVRISG